jgi:hypothetical protein
MIKVETKTGYIMAIQATNEGNMTSQLILNPDQAYQLAHDLLAAIPKKTDEELVEEIVKGFNDIQNEDDHGVARAVFDRCNASHYSYTYAIAVLETLRARGERG